MKLLIYPYRNTDLNILYECCKVINKMSPKIWRCLVLLIVFFFNLNSQILSQSLQNNIQISWNGTFISSDERGNISRGFNSKFINQVTPFNACNYISLSNKRGELLLYSDGYKIFDNKHHLINGSLSNYQIKFFQPKCIILQRPLKENQFFCITISESKKLIIQNIYFDTINKGFSVTSIDSNITQVGFTLGVMNHCSLSSKWLITHSINDDKFLTFLIDSNGIHSKPVFSSLPQIGIPKYSNFGYSPNSENISIVKSNTTLNGDVDFILVDFEKSSGIFNNDRIILKQKRTDERQFDHMPCFSPKGDFIYLIEQYNSDNSISILTNRSRIYRYSLKDNTLEKVYEPNFELLLWQNNFHLINPNQLTLIATNSWYRAEFNYSYVTNGRYFGILNADDVDKQKVVFKDYLSNPDTIVISLTYGIPAINYTPEEASELSTTGACKNKESVFKIKAKKNIQEILWDFGDGMSGKSNSSEFKHTYTDTGNFEVKVIVFLCGQIDTLSLNIQIEEGPELTSLKDTAICEGDEITFNIKEKGKILWNTGDTLSSFRINKEGQYHVKFENSCGINEKSVKITTIKKFLQLPLKELVLCDEELELNSYQFAENYTWNTGETSNSIKVNKDGNYRVDLMNRCFIGQEQFLVKPNLVEGNWFFPNAISKNSDGLNDYWQPIGVNIEKAEINIYNRWGVLMFSGNENNFIWHPDSSEEGVYFYFVKYKPICGKEKEFKGTIQILK